MMHAWVESEIARFLDRGEPEVLSISGRWGVGKTHLWKKVLRSKRNQLSMQKYSYVSLFGINSLDDLKVMIYQSTISMGGLDDGPNAQTIKENFDYVLGIAGNGFRKFFSFIAAAAAAIPYSGKLADTLISGSTLFIKEQIICFDDLERRGTDLSLSDVMGLASMLKEERRCKVVIILDVDKLADDSRLTYERYLEKVIDISLNYSPSPMYSSEIALDGCEKLKNVISNSVVELGITNIRVISRIRRVVENLTTRYHYHSNEVLEAVVRSVVILSWCVFEPELAPKLKFVRSHYYAKGLVLDQEIEEGQAEAEEILRRYSFANFDTVDEILLDGIQRGTFDDVLLEKCLDDMEKGQEASQMQAMIWQPWTLFMNSFKKDHQEIVTAIAISFERCANAMSIFDASDSIKLLRDLGEDARADEFLGRYLLVIEDKPRSFFQPPFGSSRVITEPKLLAAFELKMKELPTDLDPANVLLKIAKNSGWADGEVRFLASVSASQYAEIFSQLENEDLRIAVNQALRMRNYAGDVASYNEITRNAVAALRSLTVGDKLNEMRIRPFFANAGIEFDEAPND